MNILIQRRFLGIGDWLFCADAIKMAKIQYPNIEISVSFEGLKERKIEPINFIKTLYSNLDYKINVVENSSQVRYTKTIPHLVYKNKSIHLIESTIQELNRETGLQVKYNQENLVQFSGKNLECPVKDKFVILPSIGKNIKPVGKELGFEETKKIYNLLSKYYRVIQIGPVSDPKFDSKSSEFLGCNFETLHSLYTHCLFYVGIVNFNMHWAGHHNIKHYISWTGQHNLGNFNYKDSFIISSKKAEDIVEYILKKENE